MQTDVVAVDRVLTLEQDPFAKGDIEVSRSRTPIPYEIPDPQTTSKKNFLDQKACSRTARKKSSGSGHLHANSGNTITPLTSG